MKKDKNYRTLLTSLLLSLPGPIVLLVAVFQTTSATQWADFFRRTAELIAIIVSFIAYRQKSKPQSEKIANLTVAFAMILSGGIMTFIAVFAHKAPTGNATLGLVIAALSLITNGIFWRRYYVLSSHGDGTIIATQKRLYRAKSIADAAVIITLLFVTFLADNPAVSLIDLSCSLVIALYLFWNARRIIKAKY
ncbi:MAG: cation transporter [Clostridiales bacterium]|jgi:divalent metal cation (Fe/Co/Zn/Cd) transporter|nr:cation transporter [Clostridiales bacterium]